MGAPATVTTDQVWRWLEEVADPEIPVISVVDLGIVRHVELVDGGCVITITPTYSGCPAMQVIGQALTAVLQTHGLTAVRVVSRLAPAWSTDWMSEQGKRQLAAYGIAAPAQQAIDISGLRSGLRPPPAPLVRCPQCGATDTESLSHFGSTPCKALYRCRVCREPFDYFKCH